MIIVIILIIVIIFFIVKSNNSKTTNSSFNSNKINSALQFSKACKYLDKSHEILNRLDKKRFEISNEEFKNEFYYAAYIYQLGFVFKLSLLGYPNTTKILAPNIGLERVTISDSTSISINEFIRISEIYRYKNNMQSNLFENIMSPEFMINFEKNLPVQMRIK